MAMGVKSKIADSNLTVWPFNYYPGKGSLPKTTPAHIKFVQNLPVHLSRLILYLPTKGYHYEVHRFVIGFTETVTTDQRRY
jgi:hypothetical protein